MYDSEKQVISTILDYADKVQREYLNNFIIEIKDERDVVTDIDKTIEQFCIELIKKHFPNDEIISEESFNNKPLPQSGRYWVIDPLDGTWNYANDIPSFAIQLAFVVDSEVTLSAINIPFGCSGREIYFSEKGHGAYLNGKRIYAKRQSRLNQTIVAVSDFSWNSNSASTEANILNALMPKIGRLRIFGSSAVSFAYLAAGRVDAYLGFDQKIWDIVPGLLLVQEAGCSIFGIDTSTYIMGDKNFITAPKNSIIEQTLINLYKGK